MAKRLKQKVIIDGIIHWITAQDTQGLLDAYLKLCIKEAIVVPPPVGLSQNGSNSSPLFGTYALSFQSTFKSNQESTTIINRNRIMKNHVLPRWNDISIDKITVTDLQIWFDDMASKNFSRETILKIKHTMSPVLDAAVEDNYISKNPLKSKRIVIRGRDTEHHRAIPKEKMEELRRGQNGMDIREKRMLALLTTTGMRFEEILGLRWEDIDFGNGWISIQRAVVHPSRNQPEVKKTKTATSNRRIPLPKSLISKLSPLEKSGFVIYSYSDKSMETPLSYTEARNVFNRIRKRFELDGYTAHDFRDTCATEWREQGIPTDVIARMLGHASSEVTEKRYVKYRNELFDGVRSIMDNLGNQNGSENLENQGQA